MFFREARGAAGRPRLFQLAEGACVSWPGAPPTILPLFPVTLQPPSFPYCKDSGNSFGPTQITQITQITSPSPDPLLIHICIVPVTVGGSIPRLQGWKHRPLWGHHSACPWDSHKLQPVTLCKNVQMWEDSRSLLCGGGGTLVRLPNGPGPMSISPREGTSFNSCVKYHENWISFLFYFLNSYIFWHSFHASLDGCGILRLGVPSRRPLLSTSSIQQLLTSGQQGPTTDLLS